MNCRFEKSQLLKPTFSELNNVRHQEVNYPKLLRLELAAIISKVRLKSVELLYCIELELRQTPLINVWSRHVSTTFLNIIANIN